MRDLSHDIKVIQAVAPAALTADAASSAIDLKGYNGAVVVMNVGVITDGKWGLEISECDTSDGTFKAVADDDLIGTEPTALETGAGKGGSAVYKVGYKGKKRYLTVTVKEEATSTTGAVIGAIVVLGRPWSKPVG